MSSPRWINRTAFNPRKVAREAILGALSFAAMVLIEGVVPPQFTLLAFVVPMVPLTLALLSAATKSLLPVIGMLLLCCLLALIGKPMAWSWVAMSTVGLLLIFAHTAWMQHRANNDNTTSRRYRVDEKAAADLLVAEIRGYARSRASDVKRGAETPRLAAVLLQKYGLGMAAAVRAIFDTGYAAAQIMQALDEETTTLDPAWSEHNQQRWAGRPADLVFHSSAVPAIQTDTPPRT